MIDGILNGVMFERRWKWNWENYCLYLGRELEFWGRKVWQGRWRRKGKYPIEGSQSTLTSRKWKKTYSEYCNSNSQEDKPFRASIMKCPWRFIARLCSPNWAERKVHCKCRQYHHMNTRRTKRQNNEQRMWGRDENWLEGGITALCTWESQIQKSMMPKQNSVKVRKARFAESAGRRPWFSPHYG